MITVTVKITDHIPRIDRILTDKLNYLIEESATWAGDRITSSWSANSPSAIGSPPAIVTGELNNNVTVNKRRDLEHDGVTPFSINVDTDYAEPLETDTYNPPVSYNRPFFLPVIEELENVFPMKIERIVRL